MAYKRLILDERGVNTSKMNGDEMRKILSEMEDFKNVKGHICLFLPKVYPELTPLNVFGAKQKGTHIANTHCHR